MQLLTFAAIAALSSVAIAQTPPGFSPGTNKGLNVTYSGGKTVSPPGKAFAKDEASEMPTISLPGSAMTPTSLGLIAMVDLDVPQNGKRVPLLHWLAANIPLTSSPLFIAPNVSGTPYLGPSPPPGDFPHRYVFAVFAQPPNFKLPAGLDPIANRVGFDIAATAQELALGDPVAGTFLTVQNGDGSAGATNTFPPIASGTGGAASSTASGPGASSSGAAGRVGNGVGVGALGALALALL